MAPRESRHTLHAAREMHALGNRASAPLAFTSAARQQGIPSCDLFGSPCPTYIWRFPGPPDRETYRRKAFGIIKRTAVVASCERPPRNAHYEPNNGWDGSAWL